MKVRNSAKEFYQKHELPNRKLMEEMNQNQQEENISNNNFRQFQNNYGMNETQSIIGGGEQKENIELLNKKRHAYRDLITILDKKVDMKIVNIKIRDETDEELKLRKEFEAEEKIRLEKEAKGGKKKLSTITSPKNANNERKNFNNKHTSDENDSINEDRLQIKEINPGDIYNDSDIKYLPYTKWLMSVYQMLKDLNVKDCQTDKSIIFNIYPQRDGIPCVSKSGKYWIKLYFMGKPRKIEIDDLMPCTKNEEFILPSSFKLSELWPALITKAIFKAHSYKRMNSYTEEIGDISIIYNLTGYICEKISATSARIPQLTNYLLSKDNHLKRLKLLAAVNFENERITSPNLSNNHKLKKYENIMSSNKKASNMNLGFLSRMISKSKKKFGKREEDSILSNDVSEKNTTINQDNTILSKKPSMIKNLFKRKTNSKKMPGIENEKKRKKSVNFNTGSENQFDINSVNTETGKEGKDPNKKYESNILNIKEEENEIINNDKDSEFNSVANNETLLQGNNAMAANRKALDIITENNDKDQDLDNGTPNEKNKGKRYQTFINNLKKGIMNDPKKRNSTNALVNLRDKVKDLINVDEKNAKKNAENNQNIEQSNMLRRLKTNESPFKTTKDLINCKIELDENPPQSQRDDILRNYLYPIVDFFENKKFNMSRLKPIDFSDIKRYGKDEKIPGIYKQLSKEDKKKYLENLVQIKNKQKEMKDQRIKELKDYGRRYNFVKIVNCTLGIPRLDFFIPFSDTEIFMSKKCIQNNWEFPPPSYFEKCLQINNNNELDETQLRNHNENTEDDINHKPELSTRKKLSLKNIKKEDEKNMEDAKETEKEKDFNNNNKSQDKSKSNHSKDKENLKKSPNSPYHRKSATQIQVWNKDIYLSIINNNLAMYENCVEPFNNYNGGTWMPLIDFKKNFNSYILLHSQKSFKNFMNCDNLWHNNSDCFEYNESTAVIYLNNFSMEKENLEENNNEKMENEIALNLDDLSNSKNNSLLILFEPNITSDIEIPQFFDLLQYINFDLIDSYGNEIQANIFLSKFHSCYFNDKLDKEKNYFILMKSFVCPFGFNFSIYSDHVIDKMDYGTYLKKFNNFQNKIFKIEHPSFEKNSYSLIAKFKVKLVEKTYFRLKLIHEDKMLKKFVEVWLHFGKNSQIKKRLNFDLNEKILFDPLENNDEYIFAFLINPAYSTNEGLLDIDFSYDNDSTVIEQIEQMDPFVISDRVKYDKYGIIFKEFFISGENTFVTFNINLNFSNKNALNNKELNENEEKKINNNKETPSKANNLLSNLNSNSNINPEKENETKLKSPFFNGPGPGGKDENFNPKIFKEDEKRLRLKIKILKSEELIYEEEFFNRTCIQNILLNENEENLLDQVENMPISPSNKDSKNPNRKSIKDIKETPVQKEYTPYKLICTLDQSEEKEKEKLTREILETLEWSMKIYSNDLLGVSVDTGKEDSEKLLKDNWEMEEPGRSEKANKSRIRHLLMIKKRSGKILTPDEEQILKEERPRTVSALSLMNKGINNEVKEEKVNEKDKKNLKKEEKKNESTINKKQSVKGSEKNSLPQINSANMEEILKLNEMERPVTVDPEKHKCKFIKKFLTYTEQERLIKKDLKKEEHRSKKNFFSRIF